MEAGDVYERRARAMALQEQDQPLDASGGWLDPGLDPAAVYARRARTVADAARQPQEGQ